MKKKGKKADILLILIFLAGLSLLLYPALSNYVNTRNQSYAIADYSQQVEEMDRERYEQMRQMADEYNKDLLRRDNAYGLTPEQQEEYESLLNVSGTGIMAYVEIPCINCRLPIYHGTDEAVLQVAVGHLEWSSLPVGGENTHSVISGHRGLPSAELLTNIDRMVVGDAFYIHVLDQVLEYRVDDIAVVLPDDTSRLRVVAGEDYMTLVTCTPYGINSHRLLVRGVRVPEDGVQEPGADVPVADEIRRVPAVYVVPTALCALIAAAGALSWMRGKWSARRTKEKENEQTET